MGLGPVWILDDTKMANVPGTALFTEDPNAAAKAAFEGINLHSLKHGTGKDAEIILVPQPADDPNDPLNWPRWRKIAFFITVVYGTIIVGVLGPLVSADQPGIAADFGVSVQAISRILGSWLVFTLAIATVFLSVLSMKIGKRPVYLGTSFLLIVSCVWASYCTNLHTFTPARIIGAIGMAPLEFLVGSSIADIYFLHERAVPVTIWNVAFLEGINLTSPIAGQILRDPNQGWRWCYRYYAIACAPLILMQYFFMPETRYIRKVNLPHAPATSGSSDKIEEAQVNNATADKESNLSIPAKKTFWQECAIFSGIYPTRNSIWMLLLQPCILLFTPGLLWGGFIYGLGITWLVLLATGFALIFGGAPYNFDAGQSGLIYMSPFVFAGIAGLLSGPLTNWITKKLSKRNGGVYEPEFALIPTVFYLVFTGAGLFGFGMSLAREQHWAVPVVFFGLVSFGLVLGTSSTVSYVVNMHSRQADAALAALIVWKNMYSFALTWKVVDWILADGIEYTFIWVGSVTVATALTTIPLYIFGKRLRSLVHRKIKLEGEGGSVAH